MTGAPGRSENWTLPDPAVAGDGMYALIRDLYPICRSITGNGVRETLRRLTRMIPMEVHEVPTGTRVFDWTVPKEWNIQDAYVKDERGTRIIDFARSNLHVVNYSIPVRAKMKLAELRSHLHTLPEHPEWVPYRTSYYSEDWGFCLSHRQLSGLSEGTYEVCIDSSLEDGHLTYGECYLPGERPDEILVSCHICHPSLCNDNLSGIAVSAFLAQHLANIRRQYSYRFLFIPGTIGAITWLALNQDRAHQIQHGLVVACAGDAGHATYKRSRRDGAEIDRVVEHVLKHSKRPYDIQPFSPRGYDERQYCSPGFNLPVGCFSRTSHGRFAEYHTSADDLTFVKPEKLAESLAVILAILSILERDRICRNQYPMCEPQLGRRGLYGQSAGRVPDDHTVAAMLWVLNLADGNNSLLSIAERADLPFDCIDEAARLLTTAGLVS
jgi:aminopeptidase-like protein